MNIIAAPDLKVTSFTLGPLNAGDEVIENPYTGKRLLYRKAPGSWQGTIRYGTLDPDPSTYDSNKRSLLGFHSLLQGFNNIVNIILPNDYQPKDVPENAGFNVSGSVLSSTGLSIGVAASGAGGFSPAINDYLNIGDRLYVVREANNYLLKIFPEVEPTTFETVRFYNVFIKAQLDGNTPIGRDRQRLIEHTFPFWEHI